MNIAGITIADKILTATIAAQSIADVPMPATWIAAGVDIFSIDLWSDAVWTLKGLSAQTAVTVAANQVVTLAIRINRSKTATLLPFLVGNANAVNMLAHALDHAYADQG